MMSSRFAASWATFARPLAGPVLAALACLSSGDARAHFQEIIPSTDAATAGGTVTLDLVFTHPMDRGPAMAMAKPRRMGVKTGPATEDLLGRLEPQTVDGKSAWRVSYDVKKPGGYVFFVEPAPYWEPAEGKMIVHYTKVVVDGFESGEAWDQMVGFPVEIEPLVKPTAIWTGNMFRGVVRKGGKPVPFAEVEVEWKNDGSIKPPHAGFSTQVIKADANGTFAYVMPRAGWWGFAALVDGDKPMKSPDGQQVPVELGALMWVRAVDMK
jgi:cobalt/nickel transport protein